MIATQLPVSTGAEALRVARALGAHRYVAGRLVLVHAIAFDALDLPDPPDALREALAWARGVLRDADVDAATRDPRLLRSAAQDEWLAVLGGFWTPGARGDEIHDRLLTRLDHLELAPGAHPPFDEASEDDVHPALIDAGWELLPLASLDPERHRGAMLAFDEPILFEGARFDEESAIPPITHLQELPVFGPVELLRGVDADGTLIEPLVLWTEGNAVYQDYVLRGVLRAAGLR